MTPAKQRESATVQNSSNGGQQTGGWVSLLLKGIKDVSAAREKWAFISAGLDGEDQEELAENLFRFCGGSKEQLRRALKEARQFRNKLPCNILLIRQAAEATEAMVKGLHDIAGIIFHDPDFERLASLQRTFADEVQSVTGALEKNLARGIRVDRDGNITGGRGEALSIIVALVDCITPDPYALISPLVAAIRRDVNPSYEHIADALRNTYNRECRETTPKSIGMERKLPGKRTGRSQQEET
jgi:hypothetical protein